MSDINENLIKVAEHWEKAAEKLFAFADDRSVVYDEEPTEDECLRNCDETAAIVLKDCAEELRRVAAGGLPTLDMTPEEKLLRALGHK